MNAHARARDIRAYLLRRKQALCAEIDHYPTPIARCDEQLTGLIEARDDVMRLLRSADDESLVRDFAAAGRFDDPEALALRQRRA
jgi:hypothetical protein